MVILYPTFVGVSMLFPTKVGFCYYAQKWRYKFMYITQETANKINLLLKNKGKSQKLMLEECNLNKNVISTMLSRGSMPKADNLAKIADYLDCSVDYLLGRTDNPNSHKQ